MDSITKAAIDTMSYEQMLRRWRHAPAGDPMFQGETGQYFADRMAKLKSEHPDPVGVSKRIGW